MFSSPPSIEQQRNILKMLWEARDNLIEASNDYVNLELYQIESENIKKDLNRHIKKIVDALLKRIAKFCE
jgi:hypothetical protein